MKIFLFISVFLYSFCSYSQSLPSTGGDSYWKKNSDSNSVIVHKDPRLDLLIKKQIQINEETSRDTRRIGKGYRLLVINTSKRDEAIEAKSKVYTHFPELKSYLIYQSPYFKLKVGNFKEKKDAEDYQHKLKKIFPRGVFIMNDVIEIKLEIEKESDPF